MKLIILWASLKSIRNLLYTADIQESGKSLFDNMFNLFVFTLSQPYENWQLYAHGAPNHRATF